MHMRLRSTFIAISAAIMAVACSARQTDSTEPGVTGDRFGSTGVTGVWVHTAIGPVYRESMTLVQEGKHLSGVGTYAIEAGRTGPTTIDGTISGSTLTLTITRDYGLVESFTGTVTDATHLSGTLSINGSTQTFSYARQ